MTDQISELNKLYDDTVNASYFSSLLTPRTQKMQSYENVATKCIEYIANNPNTEKLIKIDLYNKIISLYEYLNNQENIIKYKLERYSLLTNEELSEELGNIREMEIIKLLDSADTNMKIKLYKYLIENLKLKNKYIVSFVDYLISLTEFDLSEFKDYIQELFKNNLGSINTRKYAEALIKIDKNNAEFCCKYDPLPSNIDYYKSL